MTRLIPLVGATVLALVLCACGEHGNSKQPTANSTGTMQEHSVPQTHAVEQAPTTTQTQDSTTKP